jgi:hypothetical protein
VARRRAAHDDDARHPSGQPRGPIRRTRLSNGLACRRHPPTATRRHAPIVLTPDADDLILGEHAALRIGPVPPVANAMRRDGDAQGQIRAFASNAHPRAAQYRQSQYQKLQKSVYTIQVFY